MARSTSSRVRTAALALMLLVAPGAVVVAPAPASASPAVPAAAASGPCGPEGNEIACENDQRGADPEVWDIDGAGDDDIQGYATDISVDAGQSIGFKVDTDALDYTITIYRTGWYRGDGAREIDTVEPTIFPDPQPECRRDQETDLYDCGAWRVSATWQVPDTAVSGVYVALLERGDTGGRSHITFVVRDDDSDSDILFQTSDTTWQAYNTYGGSSFYQGAIAGRAYKLSYNRPFATRSVENGRDFYFSAEYAMVRYLERNGYDVSYTTGVDSDRRGDLIRNHRVFTSTGHDEYWSGQQRANVEAARDAGVNLAFFSGNEMYWRVRWEDATAGDSASYRTLTSYKETWANSKLDPTAQWTGTWRDPRFAAPADGGGMPENALTGTAYMSNHSDLPVTVSAEEGRLRLWRGTELAGLPDGGSAALAPHTVGYESNEDLDNGSRPPGLIRLSTTKGAVPQYLQDFGNVVAPGSTTHHLTMYRAPSGALVFSAGSVQWAWGLDQEHDGDGAPADPRMQQATANLLADMDALPATLQDDLEAPTASTDETAPTAAILTPVAGQRIANGTAVTATGTAADAGGRVAGVEVSTDDGATWHPAEGAAAWSYTYIQSGDGPVALLARAIDDSANIGAATRVDFGADCPCTVFGARAPQQPAVDDAGAVELGLRFTPQIDGFASGVRFYRGEGNTGRHVGTLWTAGHQRLSTVEFADDPALGWQTARFATAVPLTAGQTYIVSYAAPSGHYAAQADAFWSRGLLAPPLSVAGGFGAESAGVYAAPGEFPSASWGSSHYFVDVIFATVDDSPLVVTAHQPLAGSGSVARGTQVAATMSKPIDPASAQLTLVAPDGTPIGGAVSYDAPARRVVFAPSAPLAPATTYTATVMARDPQGRELEAPDTWTFTTTADDRPEGACPCSLFPESTEPMMLEVPETVPLTLGVRFSAASAGTISAIRFYKGPGNTGEHRGELWSAGGSRIVEATFRDETTQGWQTAVLDQPVHIDAGSEYIASYTTTVGRYAYSIGSFDAGLVRGPLSVPVNGGAYSYEGGFPGGRSPGDYLVDVVFTPDDAVPTLLEAAPGAGALGVDPATAVTARFDLSLAAGAQLTVTGADGPVAGTTQASDGGRVLAFTPSAPLQPRASYTVQVSGVGATPVSWSFETAAADGCPCTLFGGETPVTASAADASRVELGMQFAPSEAGVVTGIRFYRGPANPGPHTGTLWSAGGDPLATVVFPDTGSVGWQTSVLAEPYPVQAGTSYVVSYLAPGGGYAAEADRFAGGAIASGPLTAGAANGRYAYGGGFPQDTWRATNYFVDVVFERG